MPGRAKTRLARSLGQAGATCLYRAFLQDLSVALDGGGRWELVAAHDDPGPGRFLLSVFGGRWRLAPQREGDLGERLASCFGASREDGVGMTVVAGSDLPTLSEGGVARAFALLKGAKDVVIAPSPDGGFGLIGLASETPADFLREPIAWSSSRTLEETEAAARRAGLAVRRLPPIPDVDEEVDLDPLREFLEVHPEAAPATRAALARIGEARAAGKVP